MMGPGARLALLIVAAVAVACTSTEETLDPAALIAPSATTLPSEPAGDAAAATPAGTAVAAAPTQQSVAGAISVRIDPIVGAPAGATDSISTRLTGRGSKSGFSVAAPGDTASTHILKGYFSASPERGDTTIFYVWDVMDAAGNRVHRFSGQEKVKGNKGWPSVTEEALQAIADRTATDLGAWLAGGAARSPG